MCVVIGNAMKQLILLTNSFRWTLHSMYPTEARIQVCYTCCCQMFICNAMKHVTLLTHSFRWNPTTAHVQICCYTCCCQISHLQRHETSYSTNKLVQMSPTLNVSYWSPRSSLLHLLLSNVHLQRHETCHFTNTLLQMKSYYSPRSNLLLHLLLSNISFATPWNKLFY
jgi:hypothetical protein